MNQIVELVEAPPALKNLAVELMENAPLIETTVFGAYMEHMDGCVGTYVPQLKTVYIDLGNALNDNALFNHGMMFIPGIWYTIIWALGHEAEHSHQLEADSSLIEFEKLPQELEDMAMQAGQDLIMDWSQDNTVPGIHELGWLGQQLVVMLNAMYTKHPDIADEPTHVPLGAAAKLEDVFAIHEFTDNGKEVLIEEIDAGNIGVKVGNDRFLTAYEFFGL